MAAWRRGVPMGPWAAAPPPSSLLPRTRRLGTGAGPRDPYEVLGVRPEASPQEIRAAFLARCKEVHPDGDPGDPSRHGRFLLLAEAYGSLRGRPPPGTPPPHPKNNPPPHTTRGGGTQSTPKPPRSDPNRRYWEQFRAPPPGPPPAAPPRRLLGLCLLLALLGGVAHALAYRYVAGAHAAFLDRRDRELTAVYERARSRAGSREEVLQRLRTSRHRKGGGEGGA